MFSLSCWDVLSSIAMALTTLPMPKDILLDADDWKPGYVFEEEPKIHPTGGVHYNFNGIILGNTGTCSAQGFAIMTGQFFALVSNVCLSVYYLCSIRFKMTDQTMQKKLLPAMVAVACLAFLPVVARPLFAEMYNPQPQRCPYCTIGSFPFMCSIKPWECIRGGHYSPVLNFAITIGFSSSVMTVSLVLVVISIFQTNMSEKHAAMLVEDVSTNTNSNGGNNQSHMNAEHAFETNNSNDPPSSELQEQSCVTDTENPTSTNTDYFQETKTVLRLALMYIGAFFLTWIWTTLIVIGKVGRSDGSLLKWILDYGRLFGLPSQGSFNALIFIYNKIHIACQCNPSLSFSQALKMVVCNPSDAPEVLVSSLDMVIEDVNQREEQQRIHELVEADIEREEEEEGISEISPASIPSNFVSLDTPSFALSNVMSSQGIDKELEMKHKKNGDPNDTRRFYASTEEDILRWTAGDTTREAPAMSLDSSPPPSPPAVSSSVLPSHPRAAAGGIRHKSSGNMRSESSVFTSNSLLSGFSISSSALPPCSTNSHISEDEDEDENEEREEHAVADEEAGEGHHDHDQLREEETKITSTTTTGVSSSG